MFECHRALLAFMTTQMNGQGLTLCLMAAVMALVTDREPRVVGLEAS